MGRNINHSAGYAAAPTTGASPTNSPNLDSVGGAIASASPNSTSSWSALAGGNTTSLKIAVVAWGIIGIWSIFNLGKR